MVGDPLLEPSLKKEPGADIHRQHSIVAAIDISTFTDLNAYRDHADGIIEQIKNLPCAEGHEQILVPGELEDQTHDERMRDGVPLPKGTIEKLKAAAHRFGVSLPELIS
jgi:LDH2 family malate/lactate/ureidoglycolate dehydrogenase